MATTKEDVRAKVIELLDDIRPHLEERLDKLLESSAINYEKSIKTLWIMKLELKNVKIHPDMSEETTCFNAYLYINGKRAAYCKNAGYGGATDIDFDNRETMLAFKEYCKENPIIQAFNGKEYTFDSMEVRIDELLVEYQCKKDLQKWQKNKLCLHKIGSKDPDYIIHATFPIKQPIKTLLETEDGRVSLKIAVKAMESKGYIVMNKNLKDL